MGADPEQDLNGERGFHMTVVLNEGHSGQHRGAQMMNPVIEQGLYTLVAGSRKPETKVFKRQITQDVLPSIRRHPAAQRSGQVHECEAAVSGGKAEYGQDLPEEWEDGSWLKWLNDRHSNRSPEKQIRRFLNMPGSILLRGGPETRIARPYMDQVHMEREVPMSACPDCVTGNTC